jgi:hypothetical protein
MDTSTRARPAQGKTSTTTGRGAFAPGGLVGARSVSMQPAVGATNV